MFWRLLRRDFQMRLKLMANDFQLRFSANLRTNQKPLQFVDAADGILIETDQQIALAQSGARSGTIGFDVQNQNALRLFQAQVPCDARMNRGGLTLDA